MSKLTEKEYWDSIHVSESGAIFQPEQLPFGKRAKRKVKNLLGPEILARMSEYEHYLRWEVICPKHLPDLRGAKVVEIGSAPGELLVKFSRQFGCIPFGIEYSEVGVEVNRRVFREAGLNPDNVIHADFFSDDFQTRHKDEFDVVYSGGFIEHFSNVDSVIDHHLNILKPGGHFIITIPNLRGMNYVLARLFDREAIPRHNIDIMRKKTFSRLFQRPDVQTLFCDYFGTFTFCLFTAEASPLKTLALRTCHKIQPLLNLTFRTCLGNRGAETGMFSPFLMCIGRKLPARKATRKERKDYGKNSGS